MEVAIVDYGMGNLFSVQHACTRAGLHAGITTDSAQVRAARAAILPGVGAFAEAMHALTALGLSDALRELAAAGKPLLGICLGLQLLMSESQEFGRHPGLGLIAGDVVKLSAAGGDKVPHVGWSAVHKTVPNAWDATPLSDTADGSHMYFVHSFHVRPGNGGVAVATAHHGDTEFCAAVHQGNIFACQFHPERSGLAGLRVYENFARQLRAGG
jgi:imidazole glycerol-phosphate synthase subunit HisH